MKKLLFLLLMLLPCGALAASPELTVTFPESIRPYAGAVFSVSAPQDGDFVLTLTDEYIQYEIARQPLRAGETDISWDGLCQNGEAPRQGTYTLRAELESNTARYACEASLRILSPAAALQYCIPSADAVYIGQDGFLVNYLIEGSGLMHVQLAEKDAPEVILKTWGLEQSDGLPHIFSWNGLLDGRSVPAGDYLLTFSIKNSPQEPFRFDLRVSEDAPEVPALSLSSFDQLLPAADAADSAVWACLMQPVTVVDIGRLQHQSIYAQPSDKSAVLGTMHGQTHGVAVLELNVSGYARIGTWRQEDGEYIEGYVPQRKLMTVTPNAHYGLVVDKNAQTLSVYQDGQKVGTMAVSTGLMAEDKLFRETLAGAFLTNDRSISFRDEGYQYNYAIRIDGDNLIHSAGCRLRGMKFDYGEQIPLLGSKASHGCVRVDPQPNKSGLNIYWLWTHIPYNTKVLVLDDPEARAGQMTALQAAHTPAPTAAPTPSPTAFSAPAIKATSEIVVPSTAAPTAEVTEAPDPTPTPEPAYSRLLAYKSHGLDVLQLQERLAELGYYALEADGAFGNGTYNAVVAFQRQNRLSADGVVGEKTFAALWAEDAVPAPTPTPAPEATDTSAPTVFVTGVPTQVPSPETPVPSSTPAPTAPPPPETTIVITLAGDALLGSEDSVRRKENSFDSVVNARGYDYPLQHFAPLFSADDVTYINLECVLKDNSQDKTEGRMYNFRGPTAFAQILTAASVEHVNIANNHYIDYGFSGRRTTRAALEAAGITYSGYTWTWIYEKDGVKIGFAGIRETTWKQDRTQPVQEIRALQEAGCDYILYACHFGTEYETAHNALQTEMAHAILDAGADCIVGTHPHVVQGIESYGGKPIFYSLGNFVFGGNLSPTDYDGLAVQLTLHFDHGGCDGVQARLLPLMTSGVQDGTTDFCPVLAEGADAERILARIQADSALHIADEMVLFPAADNGK